MPKGEVNCCSSVYSTYENKDFVIYSDASKLELDCVLIHRGKIVTYAFKQLKIRD